MEKVKEIELLQSLKGDTYFAELFGDQQIDAMCENIKNDHPIEPGINIFEGSSVAKENAELKKQLAGCQERENTVAEDLLIKADEQSDDSLADLAECLVGSKKCLAIKLRLALYLTGDDRVTIDTMKQLSANSKLGQKFVRAYNWSTRQTLEDVYVKSSTAKQAAFKRCQRVCEAENGYRLKVISANYQTFTVAFQVKTGLRVITRCNDYLITF